MNTSQSFTLKQIVCLLLTVLTALFLLFGNWIGIDAYFFGSDDITLLQIGKTMKNISDYASDLGVKSGELTFLVIVIYLLLIAAALFLVKTGLSVVNNWKDRSRKLEPIGFIFAIGLVVLLLIIIAIINGKIKSATSGWYGDGIGTMFSMQGGGIWTLIMSVLGIAAMLKMPDGKELTASDVQGAVQQQINKIDLSAVSISPRVCPKCGKPAKAGAKICGYCGEELQKDILCPNCGKRLEPGMRFCPYCETKLDETSL